MIGVIKIRGIVTFDINVHFCLGLMWDSVTMQRMKKTKQKRVKEIRKFYNLMQGAHFPGFRMCTLKFRVESGILMFNILGAPYIL